MESIPEDCPDCGKPVMLFADGNENDYDALGLTCRCGWQLTFGDLARRNEKLRRKLEDLKRLAQNALDLLSTELTIEDYANYTDKIKDYHEKWAQTTVELHTILSREESIGE